MKRNLVLIFCCIGALIFSSAVFGADGPYVSGNVGISKLNDADFSNPYGSAEIEFDIGYAGGAAIGYGLNNFRLEGELFWQKNDMEKLGAFGLSTGIQGNVSIFSFLANGYYDFENTTAFTPYVSAGIGFANVEAESRDLGDGDDGVFAYQLGVGLGYAINETVTIDAKYRYFGTSNPKFDDVELEVNSHTILFGVRINF